MDAPAASSPKLGEVLGRTGALGSAQSARGEDDMETYEDWARGHEERGRAKEGRAMVVRQASRRFGAETAQQLEGLVEGMGVKELARVGDAVVDCDTGDELLEAAENGPKSRSSPR